MRTKSKFLALSQPPLGNKKGCKSVHAIYTLLGGERGIRTPGALPHNGFQDRRIRPLCHFSKRKGTTKIRFGKGERLRKSGKTPFVSLPLALILLYFLLSFFPSEKALPTAEPISTYRLCIGSKVMRCSFVISGLPSSARKASSHSTFTTSAMR